MTYSRIADTISVRESQETKARERIRSQATTSFYTSYLGAQKYDGLTFANIKRWYDGGYLSLSQVHTLWNKEVITEAEFTEITGLSDQTVELPIDEFAFLDSRGNPYPVTATILEPVR